MTVGYVYKYEPFQNYKILLSTGNSTVVHYRLLHTCI